MFYLIGIGSRKEQITQEMFECIQKSDSVFLEYYTSFYEDSLEELEKFLGKKLILAPREVVESEIEERMLEPAKEKDVTLLVMGDPLIATTHTDLLLRAEEMQVKTQVIHNISIANSITRTGLQFYKFGKITSIPFFSEKFQPRTPYLVYIDNHKMGAHSLFLLDLDPINEKYLKAHEAMQYLLNLPSKMLEEEELEEREASMLDEEAELIICSRLGFTDERIRYGNIKDLIEEDKKNPLPEPLCCIIPGDLHEMERNFLEQFR
jgi:diphthine synthase